MELISLFISFFALVLTLARDFIIPYFFKPKISLEGKNDEECIEDALSITQCPPAFNGDCYSPAIAEDMRWLRLRLKNEGGFFSKTAIKCYVKLVEIRDNQNKKIKPFNAFPLKWSQYPTPKNNLSKGEYHLIDLAYERRSERTLYPAAYSNFELPNLLLDKKDELLGPGIYSFKVIVYGDNFEPVEKEFKVELSQRFGELRFVG